MLRDQLFRLSILGCSIFLGACSQVLNQDDATKTRVFKGQTIDTYHNVSVSDPYRALEDWNNPSVQAWSDEQTKRAIQCAMSLEHYDGIKAEFLKKARAEESISFSDFFRVEGRIFAMRSTSDSRRREIVSASSIEQISLNDSVFDLDQYDALGNTSIVWYEPSPNGKMLAIVLSEKGAERGTLNIISSQNGELLEPPIPNVYNATGGGDLSWLLDSSGLHYTRYPLEGEPHEDEPNSWIKLYAHTLGTDWRKDNAILSDQLNKTTQMRLVRAPKSGDLIAWLQDGDSGRFSHLRLDAMSNWATISSFDDGHFQFIPADDGSAFLLSNSDAPMGRVLKIPAGGTMADAFEFIPEQPDASLTNSYWSYTSPTGVWHAGRLYLKYNVGGPTELRVFDFDGTRVDIIDETGPARIGELTALEDIVLFKSESYTEPGSWMSLSAEGTQFKPVSQLQSDDSGAWTDIDTTRLFATSKDGTKIPLTLLKSHGARETRTKPTAHLWVWEVFA